jgi:hypothetical protein
VHRLGLVEAGVEFLYEGAHEAPSGARLPSLRCVERIKPEETMLQQDDMYAQDVALIGAKNDQREQTALIGNALKLQELFVALWEARRRGEPFACSL